MHVRRPASRSPLCKLRVFLLFEATFNLLRGESEEASTASPRRESTSFHAAKFSPANDASSPRRYRRRFPASKKVQRKSSVRISPAGVQPLSAHPRIALGNGSAQSAFSQGAVKRVVVARPGFQTLFSEKGTAFAWWPFSRRRRFSPRTSEEEAE